MFLLYKYYTHYNTLIYYAVFGHLKHGASGRKAELVARLATALKEKAKTKALKEKAKTKALKEKAKTNVIKQKNNEADKMTAKKQKNQCKKSK